MSVADTFLRGGAPCTTLETLKASLITPYSMWCWVVVPARQWCTDRQRNSTYAPAFCFLFGSDGGKADWHLLFSDMSGSCEDVFQLRKGVETVEQLFTQINVGLHPRYFIAAGVVTGMTHDFLGLFSNACWSSFCERVISHVPRNGCVEKVCTVLFRDGLPDTSIGDNEGASLLPVGFPDTAHRAMEWSLTASARMSTYADSSIPSQQGNERLLQLLPRLNPLLWTTTFIERGAINEEDPQSAVVKRDPSTRTRLTEIEAVNCATRRMWKQRAGQFASFSVPLTITGTVDQSVGLSETRSSPPLQQHVLLVQRPVLPKLPIDIDNCDIGPLSPQPLGVELHLLQDRGEVHYLLQQLNNMSAIHAAYEDWLHEDGEVFVQLAPVEGVPFDDLDRLIAAVPDGLFPSTPLCAGSCSGLVFPRVMQRLPLGTSAKVNPLSKAHAQMTLLTPTEDMCRRSEAVFFYLNDHIEALPSRNIGTAGYTLSNEVDPVEAPASNHTCNWCGRRREKLLLCGGCKAALFCSKQHQQNAWKTGGHRKECALWKQAKEDHDRIIQPLVQSYAVSPSTQHLISTPSASYAASLIEFIRRAMPTFPAPADAPCCIHVVGVVGAHIDKFVPAVGEMAAQAQFLHQRQQLRVLLFSEELEESQRNQVYAVCADGHHILVPSTSAIGDVWHLSQSDGKPSPAQNAVLLIRLYNSKYHLVDERGGKATPSPDAVLCFGPLSGAGLTYFSAAVAVIVDDSVGRVSTGWVDSSLVGATRTQDVIQLRLKESEKCPAEVKDMWMAGASGHEQKMLPIGVNVEGMCRVPTELTHEGGGVPQPLPVYPNSYFFDIPPLCTN